MEIQIDESSLVEMSMEDFKTLLKSMKSQYDSIESNNDLLKEKLFI